jgi:hypothetical protein
LQTTDFVSPASSLSVSLRHRHTKRYARRGALAEFLAECRIRRESTIFCDKDAADAAVKQGRGRFRESEGESKGERETQSEREREREG